MTGAQTSEITKRNICIRASFLSLCATGSPMTADLMLTANTLLGRCALCAFIDLIIFARLYICRGTRKADQLIGAMFMNTFAHYKANTFLSPGQSRLRLAYYYNGLGSYQHALSLTAVANPLTVILLQNMGANRRSGQEPRLNLTIVSDRTPMPAYPQMAKFMSGEAAAVFETIQEHLHRHHRTPKNYRVGS